MARIVNEKTIVLIESISELNDRIENIAAGSLLIEKQLYLETVAFGENGGDRSSVINRGNES